MEFEVEKELSITWVGAINYEDGAIITPEIVRKEQFLATQTEKAESEIAGDEIIDLGDKMEQVLTEMKKSLEIVKETEFAFSIADRYINIQETEGGYDYFIMGTDYKEIDGGVYDNPEVTIREALDDIVEDLKLQLDYNGANGNIPRNYNRIDNVLNNGAEKSQKEVIRKGSGIEQTVDFDRCGEVTERSYQKRAVTA